MYKNNYTQSSILLLKHKKKKVFNQIKKIILSNFLENENFYLSMKLEEFRKIVLKTQNQIYRENLSNKIVALLEKDIKKYLGEDSFYYQSHLYLRATRPAKYIDKQSDSIGWHRERFYGKNGLGAINLWTPILNVNKENTLRFIPKSQKIIQKKIKFKKEKNPYTKKNSAGHKVGLLYAPKTITGGVNLKKSMPMMVPYYQSAIFNGDLIHGSAINNSKKIRFSVDMRIMPKSKWKLNSNKFHISNSKKYYIEFNK
tara:strand:+ start:546 stop:1313 length:768 start_codon:yes stop_codon:yes gene_type:complete